MPLTKKQPSIILVKPQMGENIGSAARAMLNFGLETCELWLQGMVGQVKVL